MDATDANMTCTYLLMKPSARVQLCLKVDLASWSLRPGSCWLPRLLAGGACTGSSSSQSPPAAMGLGYPAAGGQNAAEAAQAYALYAQLAEQARLAAVAETQMQGHSSQDDIKEALRELVKQEVQAARSEDQAPDKDKKPAKEDVAAHKRCGTKNWTQIVESTSQSGPGTRLLQTGVRFSTRGTST